MPKIAELLAEIRERRPFLDHLLRTQEHYTQVQGNQQAGAVTYFGFLSFFPIMALAFFVVGYVADYFPEAQDALVDAINSVLPGIVGEGANEISLTDVQDSAGAVGLIGLAGVLYAGLGWLSAMRQALFVAFELPAFEQPNFVLGKVRDLITLALVGLTLLLSVAISGVVTRFSGDLLDLIGLGSELSWLLTLLAIAVGLGANMLLFFTMFRLLANPETPKRSLWSGALLGAIGFEVLKQLSSLLIASTKGQPAFQVFGIALVLLVWINYFSRVVLYAASWAHTSAAARALRQTEPGAVQGPQVPSLRAVHQAGVAQATGGRFKRWLAPFAAGAGAMLGAVAWIRKKERS